MADLRFQQDTDSDPGDRGKILLRFAVLGVVVALALGYMVYAALANDLYSLSVTEFTNKEEVQDGRMVRVWGKLVEGSFDRQGNSITSNFRLRDDDSGAQLRATYVGVLPDLFFNTHSEIVLEGSYGQDQVFQTNNILVKCPSKYEGLDNASLYEYQ